jgi:hypothetical protein
MARKRRQPAAAGRVPKEAALGVLIRDLIADEIVDLCERLASLQERGDAAVALHHHLGSGVRGVNFSWGRNAILDGHGTGMIGT